MKKSASATKGIAKIISIITVVPIYALVVLLIIYFAKPALFGNSLFWLLMPIIALSIVPILAYPVSYFIKKIRAKGRDGQRKLAFVFSLIGYFLGFIFVLALNAPRFVALILLTYFLSGVLLAFINRVLHIKASGHSCGVTAPTVLLIFAFGAWAIPVLLVIPIVYWSRISMGRHTLIQLILGSLVSLLSLSICYFATYMVR